MVCATTTLPDGPPDGSPENPFIMKTGLQFVLVTRVKKAPEDGGGPFPLNGETGGATYTGRSEMRKQADSTGAPVATFEVTNSTTEQGRADVTLGATTTATILVGDYVFDIEFENNLDPDVVIPGSPGTLHIRVVSGVTKS